MRKIYIILIIFLASGIWSCKTKKTVIDKKEVETEEVVIDEKKKEEKKNKSEKTIIDEDTEIGADKIIITELDGKVTEFGCGYLMIVLLAD